MRAPTTSDTLLSDLAASAPVAALRDALGARHEVFARGRQGSSASIVAGALAALGAGPLLVVVAHLDDADESVDELRSLGLDARRFPALEVAPGEDVVASDLFAERLLIARELLGGAVPDALVCPVQALMQTLPPPARMDRLLLALEPGGEATMDRLLAWLGDSGYARQDAIEEPGDFAVRGGIVDVFPASAEASTGGAIRLDFFGDELESIHEIDLDTMASDRRLERVDLVTASAEALADLSAGVPPLELVPTDARAVLVESLEVVEQGRGYFERAFDGDALLGPPEVLRTLRSRFSGFLQIDQLGAAGGGDNAIDLPVAPLPDFAQDVEEAVGEVARLARDRRVVVCCQNEGERARLEELLAERAPGASVDARVAYLHRGFLWDDALALVPYHEILHRYQTRRRIRRIGGARSTDTFLEVGVGDYVVHQDHGVARYLGLKTMKPKRLKERADQRAERVLAGKEHASEREQAEYLTLEFAQGAKLHVPITQVEKVQRYVGGFKGRPPLSQLGGKRWANQKERVKESVRDLAAELLRVQAAREHSPGVRFPEDTAWQREFEAEFPYEETEDQLAALGEIKGDQRSGRPMDRLLCGDVGYGKTELAIRAAFKAAEFGKQVAVLVPTTLLAEQHERTFRERFADYPFVVESLSRFRSRREQADILRRVRKGEVDILVGTHRILSKDVRFADLGLVVVDEEQRFGVEHKQALVKLRLTADVLTLSATPIPRTLHMSMLGLRDISSLTTPPLDRRAVVTEVLPYNEVRIKRAIERELARDGQVYFVSNRVHNIRTVADDVRRLAPDARIVVGHGQMPPNELEAVMREFTSRRANVLVSTTIIESGIDIPTANTMIINNADQFGLADLHQLRGRVGRYKHRAYCYLLLPKDRPVTEIANRRLRAIEEFSMLGAGFKIAMRDLEIRGAGNLLGAEQSGHIAAVGYDMYCRLLDQAARELKSEPTEDASSVSIELGITATIPRAYIPSDARRLEAYRRLATAGDGPALEKVATALREAYGELPAGVERLVGLSRLRVGAHALGIRSMTLREGDIIIRCADADGVTGALGGIQGMVRALSARAGEALREVVLRLPDNYLEPDTLLAVLCTRLA
jgi:transcription-repair coupling factor (superfamily II helicase)